MRRKVIAGNWKMNMLPNETIQFIDNLVPFIKDSKDEIIICVPYTDLFYALLLTQGTNIKVGAQNMHWEDSGAYTGEISGKMLKAIGVQYVIIGHSERRQYFGETDETVNKKLKTALEQELKPILCVGENLMQRENGEADEFISKQIKLALKDITNEQAKEIIVAYEPIWAIGTGKNATPDDANNTIKNIRNCISKIYGDEISEKIIIQYGGSVKPENSQALLNMSDIDGALIGGASLDPKKFAQIINNI